MMPTDPPVSPIRFLISSLIDISKAIFLPEEIGGHRTLGSLKLICEVDLYRTEYSLHADGMEGEAFPTL